MQKGILVKVKSIILSSKRDTKNRNIVAKMAHKESNAYKEMVNYEILKIDLINLILDEDYWEDVSNSYLEYIYI